MIATIFTSDHQINIIRILHNHQYQMQGSNMLTLFYIKYPFQHTLNDILYTTYTLFSLDTKTSILMYVEYSGLLIKATSFTQ